MKHRKPFLIIITGRPAAGKSTLARLLSKKLSIPVISKDNIRELLFDHLGWGEREWAQKLGVASIHLMYYFAKTQLGNGGSIILDNAFDPDVTTPQIKGLQTETDANIVQIICNAESTTLFNRFFERAETGDRHPGHGDDQVKEAMWRYLSKEHSPKMNLDGLTIELDTADFSSLNYDDFIETIKKQIRCVA